MRAFVAGALLLAACKGGSNKQANAKPEGEKPPPVGSAVEAPKPGLAGVSVTIAGQPATLARAFVKRLPGGKRFQVYATSGGGSCKELLDNVFDEPGDEQSILFDVSERLGPDGTRALALDTVHYRGSLDVASGATVAIEGNADAGEQVKVTVDYAGTSDGKAWATKGTFAAEGCGARPATGGMGTPKAAHPSTASLTIAGQKLPLVNATRTGERLVLSTGPKDCSPVTEHAPAVLRQEYGRWELSGTLFPKTVSGTAADMKAVAITAGKTGTSDDGPTVELALAGEGKVGDFAVAVEGTIEALECPK